MNSIRIGLIGLGQRGLATLRRYAVIDEARIVAVSDLSQEAVAQACHALAEQSREKVECFGGQGQWKRLCESPHVDLVMVCTDWASHASIAIYAMEHGKDVALEVPAAQTVDECWQLVDTAERTGRHCTMLENCCYDTFHLGIMEMLRQGRFGEVGHYEGAYIHDLRSDHGWMSYTVSAHGGNPYPTHGLGPACQILGIHHRDRLLSLVSMTGGNKVNNTLIRTALGKTILLQFDERTPRPYSRIQTLCGTKGYAQKYPLPTLQFDGESPVEGREAELMVEQAHDQPTQALINEGKRLRVPNLMNYIMDRRLMNALKNGLSPDISVYDAALWSCVAELSAQSASKGGLPVEIPDFTRGQWHRVDAPPRT